MAEETNITTYISDMITVEHHIIQPVEKQLSEDKVKAFPGVVEVLTEIQTKLTAHVASLEQLLEANGGHPASGIKKGVGEFLGAAASTIQDVRPTKISKSLRDDYTALSLAAVGYEMLYTTALTTRSEDTATLAQTNLKDITALIVKLTGVIADVVTAELLEIDPSLEQNVPDRAKEVFRDAWDRQPAVTAQ